MLTAALLAILIALLVIVLMQLFKKTEPAPAPEPVALKVTGARAGDVVSITGKGDDGGDLAFEVANCSYRQIGGIRSRLLFGTYRDRRVTLSIAEANDVRVSYTNPPTLDDLGLTEEDLAQLDERQNTADSFEFDSKAWLYRRSREAQASSGDQAQPTGFYLWEFQEQDGKRSITISKPSGEPFTVALFTEIPATDVSVYRGTL